MKVEYKFKKGMYSIEVMKSYFIYEIYIDNNIVDLVGIKVDSREYDEYKNEGISKKPDSIKFCEDNEIIVSVEDEYIDRVNLFWKFFIKKGWSFTPSQHCNNFSGPNYLGLVEDIPIIYNEIKELTGKDLLAGDKLTKKESQLCELNGLNVKYVNEIAKGV